MSTLATRRRVPSMALVCAGVLIAWAALIAVAWSVTGRLLWPDCMFHRWTGLHCPGCGTTRAVLALSHGDFAAAFGHNALAFVLLPVIAWGFTRDAVSYARGEPMRGVLASPRWSIAIVVAVLAFTVLRNLPFAPFSLLAP